MIPTVFPTTVFASRSDYKVICGTLIFIKEELERVSQIVMKKDIIQGVLRFPVEKCAKHLASAFLTPAAARPKSKGELKRPFEFASSGESSDDDEDHEKDKLVSNLREATHLAITIIQGALQSGKSELAAFLVVAASECGVPTSYGANGKGGKTQNCRML